MTFPVILTGDFPLGLVIFVDEVLGMLHKARARLEKDVEVSRPYLFFVEKHWEKNYKASINFSVKPGADRSGTFTVFMADESLPSGNHQDLWRVDMECRSCTCGQWIAWACPHAVAAIFSDEAGDYSVTGSQDKLRKFKMDMVHEHLKTGYSTSIFEVLEPVFKSCAHQRRTAEGDQVRQWTLLDYNEGDT